MKVSQEPLDKFQLRQKGDESYAVCLWWIVMFPNVYSQEIREQLTYESIARDFFPTRL